MKISVVVCTYNRSEYLRRMLMSLREALIPEHLSCEIILVDNHSTDNTKYVFEELANPHRLNWKYVFEEKEGISHARNRGIKEAKGEIIAFTDDDVIVDKYWIQNIYKAFEEHNDVVCVGGKILPIWEFPKPEWLKENLFIYLALLDYGDTTAHLNSPKIWGANLAVKADLFSKYGLFDSNLGRVPRKLYAHEETEFVQRLLDAKEKILYYPLSVIYHCVSEIKMSKRYFRKWNFDAGELDAFLIGDVKYSHMLNVSHLKKIKLLIDSIKSIIRIGSFSKNRFNHQLRLCYISGYLCGRVKRMLKKSI